MIAERDLQQYIEFGYKNSYRKYVLMAHISRHQHTTGILNHFPFHDQAAEIKYNVQCTIAIVIQFDFSFFFSPQHF